MKQLTAFVTLFALLAALSAPAVTWLDKEMDVANWSLETAQPGILEQSGEFVWRGGRSLKWSSPNYGPQVWERLPAFYGPVSVNDWTGYDRVVYHMVNTTPYPMILSTYTVDASGKSTTRTKSTIQPLGYTAAVIDFESMKKEINAADVAKLRIRVNRPLDGVGFTLAGISLLKPGEEIPSLPEPFAAELIAFTQKQTREFFTQDLAALQQLTEETAYLPDLHERVNTALDNCLANYTQSLSAIAATKRSAEAFEELARKFPRANDCYGKHFVSLVRWEQMASTRTAAPVEMLTGTADSMKRVLPRGGAFAVDASGIVELSLARHEWESTQVLVAPPVGSELKNVQVACAALAGEDGKTLQAEVDLVAFTETKILPPYPVPDNYLGWYPDPIFRGVNSADIADGDVQSYWVRFHAADDQPAGFYTGTIVITADGIEPQEIEVAVLVRDFNVPKNMSIPTAIAANPYPLKAAAGDELWNSTNKFFFADFLSNYQMNMDNIYMNNVYDWELVKYLHDRGRLTAFNLANINNNGSAANLEELIPSILDRIRPEYEKAKEMGVLDHAYVYGFDEVTPGVFPMTQKYAKAIHDEFPGLAVMTTAYDYSYGCDSVIKDMDIFNPKTSFWFPEKAIQAREEGRYVWWYVCCDPWHPYANIEIENPAIQGRILMGAQIAKYRPEGFLYYSTIKWNKNTGIDMSKGPFTAWNPQSWTVYHGDGNMLYRDSNGLPLASIRLENYRDGMEDYAYVVLLEDAMKQISALPELTEAQASWLEDAADALVVPETLMQDLTHYTYSPAEVRAWRERVADCLEQSGIANTLDPWKAGAMGVRGLRGMTE